MAAGLLLLVMGWSLAGSALPLSPGDVLVGLGSRTFSSSGRGEVWHFAPDGTLLETLVTTSGSLEETGMCLDAARTLYTTNFEANSMSTFDASGALSQPSFGSGFNQHPNSCVVDALGHVYVGQSDKDEDFGGGGVLKLDAAGTLLATFSPAPDLRGTDWVDLAADQCTLFYTSGGASIKRFDVCAAAQLPDFCSTCAGVATDGSLFGLRLLPDGGVLAAEPTAGMGVVHRYGSDGAQVASYTVVDALGSQCGQNGEAPCFFPWALALDPDRTSFWVADRVTGEIFRLALGDGTVLARFVGGNCADPVSSCAVSGLAIVGEPTAAAAVEAISVTASITAAGKTYDGTVAAMITSCTLSGVVGSDAVGCVASDGAFAAPGAGAGKPVTATVSLTGADAGKYTLTASTAATTASVAPAPASVTAAPATKMYGSTDPPLIGTLSGFFPADGVTATFGRSPGENVAGSPYTVSATLSPVDALGNYAIVYNTAIFTITPATPIVTWADPADITYPTSLSSTQLNATADVPGAFDYTPLAGTVLDVGNGQLLSVLFTPADSSNYATASAQVQINVLPATSASCPDDPNAVLTRAVDGTGTTHGSVPVHTTLQAAYDAAGNREVIGMFSETAENVALGGAKSLTITRCAVGRLTASDSGQPVWNITSTGALTIIGTESVGGSIGWRIATSHHAVTSVSATGASQYGILVLGDDNGIGVNAVSGSPVGIRVTGNNNDLLPGGSISGNAGNGVEVGSPATGNRVRSANIQDNGGNGVQVDGSGNTVNAGHIDSNTLNGILVNGSGNTIKGNTAGTVKGKGNGQAGLKIVGGGNTLDNNTANANGGVGFDLVGPDNKLRGNQANQSQGGNKVNTGCEYRFADDSTLDQGGNKKDTATFAGGLPGPRYTAGCYW